MTAPYITVNEARRRLGLPDMDWECYDHDCREHEYDDPDCNHGADGCTVRQVVKRAGSDRTMASAANDRELEKRETWGIDRGQTEEERRAKAVEEARVYEHERTKQMSEQQDKWPLLHHAGERTPARPDLTWEVGTGRVLKDPGGETGPLPAPPDVCVWVAGDIADEVKRYAERLEATRGAMFPTFQRNWFTPTGPYGFIIKDPPASMPSWWQRWGFKR